MKFLCQIRIFSGIGINDHTVKAMIKKDRNIVANEKKIEKIDTNIKSTFFIMYLWIISEDKRLKNEKNMRKMSFIATRCKMSIMVLLLND
jgi:hypothetical protein